MEKTKKILIVLTILISLLNFALGKILENSIASFSGKIKYSFLDDVLVRPYFTLMISSFIFDIFYFTLFFLLKNFVFNMSTENNIENIRTKSVRENELSNRMIIFLFTFLIKGIAQIIGIFYVYEINIEINRLTSMREESKEKIDTFNTIKSRSIFAGIFNVLSLLLIIIKFIYDINIIRKNKKPQEQKEKPRKYSRELLTKEKYNSLEKDEDSIKYDKFNELEKKIEELDAEKID